ncbi:MAG TPA: GDP-L-fucose synthase [Gemmatimonadaceae bacterium]|jgi:GDP-L-fucose synthase|nr:GDP-L-fucose synthase [Gemmatimonadaceae bacterium]
MTSSPTFWTRRRVLVTGGTGFLGGYVVERLRERGADVSAPTRDQCDLLDARAIDRTLAAVRPQMIVHLAATVGGIGANQREPGRFFYENVMMGVRLIEAARTHGVAKIVVAGTVCAYPKHTPVPFHEENLWDGYPEDTNAPYGIAKKALLVQLQAYRQQYGLNGIFLIPVNLYGPGDTFDPARSHVIPALIRKMVDARRANAPTVEVWGTGKASREFLYVEDCARAVVMAAERYDAPDPVNIGAGAEITIADLARLIARLSGYEGTLRFNAAFPDGQPRRSLDVSRAEKAFGFRASTPFEEGLRRTIKWFERHEARAPGNGADPRTERRTGARASDVEKAVSERRVSSSSSAAS